MDISLSFNPAKSERNRRERNLPFERAYDFDFETAEFFSDQHFDFPERRFVAIGYLDDRLHILVFAELENCHHVISFRKAHEHEAEEIGIPQKRYR